MRRGYVDILDGQMHYREEGEGSAVVLIHQILRTSLDYNLVMPYLSASHRVIAFDMMGCGDSDAPTKLYSMEDHGAAICVAMDNLGINGAAVAGHHSGANVAMEVAVQRPDLVNRLIMSGLNYVADPAKRQELYAKALTLCDPERRPDGSHLVEIWKEGLTTHWGMPRLPPNELDLLTNFFLEQIKTGPRRFEPYVAQFSCDTTKRLPLVKIPSLIIYASDDIWVCRGEDEILKILPSAKKHEIEGRGDLPRLNPEKWAVAILDFLKQ